MGMRGQHVRLTDVAMDEAEDAVLATHDAVAASEDADAFWQEALSDGELTVEEAREGLRRNRLAVEKALKAEREAAEAVEAAERATVAQALAENLLRGGVTERVGQRARRLGFVVPIPAMEFSPDAA